MFNSMHRMKQSTSCIYVQAYKKKDLKEKSRMKVYMRDVNVHTPSTNKRVKDDVLENPQSASVNNKIPRFQQKLPSA